MILNVVVTTSGKVFPISSSIMASIEGILLIIRSIFAVLYGYAIHSLKSSDSNDASVDVSAEQMLRADIEALVASQHARMADLEQRLGNLQSVSMETVEETEEYTPVHFDNPKETIKLLAFDESQEETIEETEEYSERNTDKLIPINRKRHQSGNHTGNNSDAVKRIHRMLKKNPEIGPKELAEKAGVTKGYASKVKAQFLKEQWKDA
jgi:hypothetical protein